MSAYRCFFTRGDSAPTLKIIESDRDDEVVARASDLLELRPADLGLEIWKEERLLVRVARAR
jgi:hypothetical protein